MVYNEDDFLQLSGVQHFAFCRRQWALIHIEQQWGENLRTAEGELLHQNAHDNYRTESRGDVIISRGMPVFSRTLGANGACDIVEFRRCENGITLHGKPGAFEVYPVEYKRGKPKDTDIDILQLAAQAVCLEEMLVCEINCGAVFYGETRHRLRVELTDEMKKKVRSYFEEMHEYFRRGYTPCPRPSKSCNACSLNDLCLPRLAKTRSAKSYNAENLGTGEMT